jgi:hypothetical protein
MTNNSEGVDYASIIDADASKLVNEQLAGKATLTLEDLFNDLKESPISYDAPPNDTPNGDYPSNVEKVNHNQGAGDYSGYDWSKYPSDLQEMSKVQAKTALRIYEDIQATLCAWFAGNFDKTSDFGFDVDTKKSLEPLIRYELIQRGGVVPNWFWLLLGLGGATASNVIAANAYRQLSNEDKALLESYKELDAEGMKAFKAFSQQYKAKSK